MPEPIDKTLYNQVKREAKRKFDTWPSIYASSWLVHEYKKRGGKYRGQRPTDKGLNRWYKEEWIDVCHWPKKVECGRTSNVRKYPYCRPSRRVNSKTPKTVQELTKKEREQRCRKKRREPSKRLIVSP